MAGGRVEVRARNRSRFSGLPVVGIFIGLLFGFSQASAQHPGAATIEQHWELMGRRYVTTTGGSPPMLVRGPLPGGTSKFDPQPTATFEVAGRITAGVSGTWTVSLQDDSLATIAQVSFGVSDSSFRIKTAGITWPSTDRKLYSLGVTKSGTAPGQLELQKAYVKIHQSGTIKKTVGRYPIAAPDGNGFTSSWSDIDDPVLYKHYSSDFDPSPTARLRAATFIYDCAAPPAVEVRLVDSSGTVAPGSLLRFDACGTASAETAGITLTSGETYRLQARQDASEWSVEFYGADLVFEQATTDTHGLRKTVGWYPSVTTPTDMLTDATNLGFLFNAPTKSTYGQSLEWYATLKKTTGTTGVSIGLYDVTAGAYRASVIASDTAYELVQSYSVQDAPAGNDLDSRTSLSLSTGRVSSSVLRIEYELWDTAPPIITAWLATTNPRFSPNGDGVKDTTTFSATLSDRSPPIAWTATVRDGSQTVVRTSSGTATSDFQSFWWTWDGKNDSGTVVPDGTYSAALTATDAVGNSTTSPPDSVTVDTVAPVVTNSVSPDRFSPNGDGYLDTATFTGSINEQHPWTLRIKNSSGFTVRTYTGTCTAAPCSVSQTWDGSGAASDGTYAGYLEATDLAGNTGSASASVVRDTTGPSISGYAASNPDFSPDGQLPDDKDTTTLTATLADPWLPVDWTFEIKSGTTVHRTFTGTGSNVSAVWDGTDDGGVTLADGLYTALLTARDAGRNSRTSTKTVRIDTVKPTAEQLLPEGQGNSVYSLQRIGAKLLDQDGSGIDAATIVATFNGGTTYSGSSITFNAASGWATTPQVTLVAGQQYTAALRADDKAGNRLDATWAFRRISQPTADPTLAQLFGSGVNKGPAPTVGMRTWEFRPILSIETRPVAFAQGSQHPGFGVIASTVPLANAEIQVTIGGITSPWPTKPFPASETRTVYQQLPYADLEGDDNSILVPHGTYELPAIQVELPETVSEARVQMTDASTAASVTSLCENPAVISTGCSPDPLRFFISDDLANKLTYGGIDPDLEAITLDYERPILMGIDRLVLDATDTVSGAWRTFQPLQSYPCIPGSAAIGGSVCLVEDVYYPLTNPVIPPGLYSTVCDEIRFCSSYSAQSDEMDEFGWYRKYRCIRAGDGTDELPYCNHQGCFGAGSEHCQQGWGVSTWDQQLANPGAVSGDTIHIFQTYWASEWGYKDGTHDELGVHWATPMKDMGWLFARAGDVPGQGTQAELNFEVGIYPETSPDNPSQQASNSWTNCFAIPGKGTVAADLRVRPQDDGTLHHGVGAGAVTASRGWLQYQSSGSCGSPPAYFRAEQAWLYASVRQGDNCGAECGTQRRNGFLEGTWGHTYKGFDFSKFVWHFVKSSAMNCSTGSCANPLGLIYVLSDSLQAAQDDKQSVKSIENANAFRYD